MMINLQVHFCIFLILLCIVSSVWGADIKTFNVNNFGAVRDGRADDLPAFLKAWEAVCQSESTRVILVYVSGNIIAPNSKSGWDGCAINAWLTFSNIDHLTVNGYGVVDGRGHIWWSNPCLNDNTSQETQCKGPTGSIAYRIVFKFPSSSNITISGITCGPGHGISIGSLGEGGFEVVEDLNERNCTIKGTLTGIRIKTWQGGEGYARRIAFEGIKFHAVNNPIIIDQFYCPSRVNCKNDTVAVVLSDITFRGILGTSLMDEVINLSCSQTVGCKKILVDRVYISSVNGNPVHASAPMLMEDTLILALP
ncbi:unnamed protein product [Withania somnifera]